MAKATRCRIASVSMDSSEPDQAELPIPTMPPTDSDMKPPGVPI
jgi:hypothetical protein